MNAPTWTVRATIVRIVDGDTFSAHLDLGWGIWKMETLGTPSRVRILNLDTPERGQPEYFEARDLLSTILRPGDLTWVASWKLDNFGRVLADVSLMNGQSVRDLMPAKWHI